MQPSPGFPSEQQLSLYHLQHLMQPFLEYLVLEYDQFIPFQMSAPSSHLRLSYHCSSSSKNNHHLSLSLPLSPVTHTHTHTHAYYMIVYSLNLSLFCRSVCKDWSCFRWSQILLKVEPTDESHHFKHQGQNHAI